MRIEAFSFGSIRIDGVTYEHDVVIDRGQVHKRKKKPSKQFRDLWALVHGRGYPLEMPSAGDRHWRRSFAGDGGSQT